MDRCSSRRNSSSTTELRPAVHSARALETLQARAVSAERHLSGFHAVTARLRAQPQSVRTIYVSASRRDRRARDLLERAAAAGVTVHAADDQRLAALAGNDKHQGVVDAAPVSMTLDEILEAATEPALLLVLDGVTDPHNLGACLRSADAFGV